MEDDFVVGEKEDEKGAADDELSAAISLFTKSRFNPKYLTLTDNDVDAKDEVENAMDEEENAFFAMDEADVWNDYVEKGNFGGLINDQFFHGLNASPLASAAAAAAEGLELVPSSSNQTDYKNVSRSDMGMYSAYRWENGKQRILGNFDTAEEAAMCYASHMTTEEALAAAATEGLQLVRSSNAATGFKSVTFRNGIFYLYIKVSGIMTRIGKGFNTREGAALSYARLIGPRRANAEAADFAAEQMTAEEAVAAASTEGLQLVPSQRSTATGFQGVVAHPSGKFDALLHKQWLGRFLSKEGAALCLARTKRQRAPSGKYDALLHKQWLGRFLSKEGADAHESGPRSLLTHTRATPQNPPSLLPRSTFHLASAKSAAGAMEVVPASCSSSSGTTAGATRSPICGATTSALSDANTSSAPLSATPKSHPPTRQTPSSSTTESATVPLVTKTARSTIAQKVACIIEELSLDPSSQLANTIAKANTTLGIEAKGTFAEQVDRLLNELGLL